MSSPLGYGGSLADAQYSEQKLRMMMVILQAAFESGHADGYMHVPMILPWGHGVLVMTPRELYGICENRLRELQPVLKTQVN